MSFLFCSVQDFDEQLDERSSPLLRKTYAMLAEQFEDMGPLSSVLQQYM